RAKLADARAREAAASAHLAEVEATLERLRIELAEADSRTTAAREAAHVSELECGRLQQQIAFDKQQVENLLAMAAEIAAEVLALENRREPARLEIEGRREAAARTATGREEALEALRGEEAAQADLERRIQGLDADVEAARSEHYAAVNAATALRHAMEHAVASQARLAEQIAKLDAEAHDLRIESSRAEDERAVAEDAMTRAREAIEGLRLDRAARESELSAARYDREARASQLRTGEHDLASISARLRSLEELDAARAEYGDGARLVLAEAGDDVAQMGSVADYLQTDSRYERAVEACLGDFLQHVVVRSHAHATAGLRLAQDRHAGRVGFLVAGEAQMAPSPPPAPGLVRVSDVVQVSGTAADAIRAALDRAWIAEDEQAARAAAGATAEPVATLDGTVFRGANVVEGGARAESRGILATKREIKELRERAGEAGQLVERVREALGGIDVVIAAAESSILSLQSELHRQEKAVVGFELQAGSARATTSRIARKQEQIASERRGAEEQSRAQAERQEEARASIARIEEDQRAADEQLNAAQRRVYEARQALQGQAQRTADAKAAHAALVERASGLAFDIQRLEDAARELESRVTTRQDDLARTESRRTGLLASIATAESTLDAGLRELDDLRERVRAADNQSQELRASFDAQEGQIREARRALEAVRGEASQLEVVRATAESDLAHLAASCVETVQATLDEVSAEVARLEEEGLLASPKAVDDAPDAAEIEDDAPAVPAEAEAEAAARAAARV
ncbi:MAG TPA: hypothetical protein VMT18_12070, partial [Planctomycetota bacterium]|nr:hypothetical protein [Planctomycetota bacterium]